MTHSWSEAWGHFTGNKPLPFTCLLSRFMYGGQRMAVGAGYIIYSEPSPMPKTEPNIADPIQ